MFRLLLIFLALACGADALVVSGAYTQAGWRTLQEYTVEMRGPSENHPLSATPKPPA